MIDPIPHPTRLLKIVAGLARWSLGLLLAFWLLLTIAWGALHGWIVPRIGDFRPQIEAHAARALGVPVKIGAISAHTEGLIPSIELSDVALLDTLGRSALRLPRVVVALSPRSLLNAGFEQLYIEGPELDMRRAPDGSIYIAGLTFAETQGDNNAAADWLFSQGEVFIKGGTVRWTDEQRGAPELALEKVDLVLRNGNWHHHMRLDATPPEAWGDRFSVVGLFRAPLLRARDGNWKHWSGQLFADFARVDVSRLRHHADVGIEVAQGRGALRAWADVQRGQVVGGTADLALADVNTTLSSELQPLVLPSVQGRLGGRRLNGGFEFSTQALQFQTDDGLVWPGGNVRLVHTTASGKTPEQGELRADRLDLAALAQIASRLPLGTTAHNAVHTYAPKGLVDDIQATWKGPLDRLQQYQVRGRIQGLALAGDTPLATGAAPTHLGLRGATVDIDMNQSGGKAALTMASGALVLPGVFEDPILPLDRLSADVRWQFDGDRIAVQASDVQFANADAQGEARATWHTSDASKASHRSRFPGVLDLSGVLNRADGTRVHRYLPLSIPADARHYVRDAVVAGSASSVQFRVKGDLHDLPFNDPKTGEFRIAARVKDVTYAYVPPRLQPANALPWPALTELGGELIFERSSMQVRGASGSFAGQQGLRLSKVEAKIPDLSHTVVGVSADARGPLGELLALMTTSPLGGMTGNALAQATGTGNADFQLRLSLPISELDKSKVQGSATLAGNELRITPDTPALSRVRGAVQFSETGFSLNNMQAQALGGSVRLEGGMRALAANAPATESAVQLRAQGTATAEGLQQTPQLGMLAQLARRATGSTPYTMALAFRRGVPELQVSTSLQGMALELPAPLGKTTDSSLPMRFESQVTRESLVGLASSAGSNGAAGGPPLNDQITLDLGALGSATYVRDVSGVRARVLRGAIGVGLTPGESAPMPPQGVAANINQSKIDVDAWEDVLSQAAGPAAAARTAADSAAPPGQSVAQDYMPTTLAVRARELTLQGRTLRNVVAGALREGTIWRANLDATELNGYLEYRQPGSADHANGRVFARLSRVNMPQNEVTQVEALLDEQPGTLPALDIVVEDFELRGKRLGRVEIEAQNRGSEGVQREWRLTKFNILAPEADFTASGNWAVLNAAGTGPRAPERRTVLNFKLEIRDSGDLLARMGMANVVRRGKGRMEGQVAWIGAPFSPDYRSMTGQINLNIESGQFLKADPGLAKLLGVLSLQSLPRRLALDFRDVFSEGFAFDFVRGDVRIEQGVATTNNLQMKGVNAAVLMEGSASIDNETQNLRVVVVPEINALTASLVATAINPVIGLGSFLAQVFLRGPLIEAATQEFRIDGTWTDPRIVRIARRGRDAAAPPAPGSTTDTAPRSNPPKTGEPL
ncbi:MAG: TIGR02099 family protein [Gammaproteobacteria bacterium]|nr:TIGR02099 family protein [Gammaproteobacteria bacterium]MBU1505993.1 TIGR02099 family protein [Gammaproteobacteria bacterium]MBU2123614.1 TIGR02099 family protein [Gammaproteobacteria bacterium]MBU2202162.1 TIGR02099 family protein [Gammaproteobacteria bacterium]MBU2275949.1 TIGR02099 family protein [Gammaproteobacteria bacterium]